MDRKFYIEYRVWESDGTAHEYDFFSYNQYIFHYLTISDVKEYVKEQRYKKHKPVCSCFLEIWKYSDSTKETISRCYEYNDTTLLNNTIFNDKINIVVMPTKEQKCKCGQFEKLLMRSNIEQIEEQKQIFEEKERQNKEYFDRRLQEEKNYYQNQINRLDNIINQQEIQNQQYQSEIQRIHQENYRRENEFNEERRANNEKIQTIERNRQQERIENAKIIKTMENERNRERQENNRKFANMEKNNNILKEKITENENEKKNLEKRQKEAENVFIFQNNNIYDNYFEKNKSLLIQNIEIELNKLIEQNIPYAKINEELIYKIVKNEKFSKNVRELLDDKITNLNAENMKINISSFNIIILGNTGVGKSTLLNTVLKAKLAKTDLGDPCTMGMPKPYESENAKGIRIWDSRGIENGKYNLETAFNDIKITIESLIKRNDPDKFIHCIWYCVSSNRFTEEEVNNLKKCYDSYIEKLPIIVVFTRSDNQKQTDQMMEKVKNKLEKAKNMNGFEEKGVNDIKILKVLAEDYEHDFGIVKSFGIHDLMEQTYESGKIGIERACTHSLMEHGQEILKEELQEIIKRLKEKIFEKKNEIIDKNNINNFVNQQNNLLNNIINEENKKKNNLNVYNIDEFDYNNFINFCKICSREIMKKLLLKDNITEETMLEIDKVIESESVKIKQFFENIFLAQLEIISTSLTEELVDFVARLEGNYKISTLSSKYHYNELKRHAKNNINKNFKPIIEDIIFRKISQILFQKFAEKVMKELLDCFHGLLKNNKKIREIFITKGKENSLVCLKRIKNLMNYPSDKYEERNSTKKGRIKSKYEDLKEDEDD